MRPSVYPSITLAAMYHPGCYASPWLLCITLAAMHHLSLLPALFSCCPECLDDTSPAIAHTPSCHIAASRDVCNCCESPVPITCPAWGSGATIITCGSLGFRGYHTRGGCCNGCRAALWAVTDRGDICIVNHRPGAAYALCRVVQLTPGVYQLCLAKTYLPAPRVTCVKEGQ